MNLGPYSINKFSQYSIDYSDGLKILEKVAKTPVLTKLEYSSFKDFVSKEVSKNKNKYLWSGYWFSNLEELKSEVVKTFNEQNKDAASVVQKSNLKIIKDVKNGQTVVVYKDLGKNEMVVVGKQQAFKIPIDKYRKIMFDLEDYFNSSIFHFDNSVEIVKIKGVV